MERIINNMMTWFNVSVSRLQIEKEIPTSIGQTLYWDYYCYVKKHPIIDWNKQTSILYGSEDNLCEFEDVSIFAKYFNCNLQIYNSIDMGIFLYFLEVTFVHNNISFKRYLSKKEEKSDLIPVAVYNVL